MKIKSLDAAAKEQSLMLEQMQQLVEEGDAKGAAQKFAEYATSMQEAVLSEAKAMLDAQDTNVLVARGVRQLTQEEEKFYQAWIEASRSPVPQQALSNLNVTLPKTTIDAVMEDVRSEHPLLDEIDFVNANGMIEMLVNRGTKQLATWSKLCGKFVQELSGNFALVPLTQNKLSAFLPVCKAMLEIGTAWLDKYVRAMLADALAFGLEKAVIDGSGLDMPTGMNRNIGEAFNVGTGYPKKAAKTVKKLDPKTYGEILAKLALGPDGKNRKIGSVIMVCNPQDYFTKVMPATVLATPTGYVRDVLPYPTKIIQSEEVPTGEAIIGISKRYFLGVSLGKDGRIEYSDEYKFVDDERVYAVKTYAAGMPKDNNSFEVLDISELKPAAYRVETVAGGA